MDPPLSEATNEQLIAELLGREDFDGAVVTATLGEGQHYDAASVQFTASIGPAWRRAELLTRAKESVERPT
jgi:hypothetical protein